MLFKLGAQGFVGRYGLPFEECLPAPVLDGVPERCATVPDDLEYLFLPFAGQNPDYIGAPHVFILANLEAAFIPRP
jgi:hypothetical protein